MTKQTGRRHFVVRLLAGASALVLAGCDAISNSAWGPKVLKLGEVANRGSQRSLTPAASLAQEYTESDLSPDFRSNGTSMPDDAHYQKLAADGFKDWRLKVDGMVEKPIELSLLQLRAMTARTQITRHDCVEGWSAIGKWRGAALGDVLALAKPLPTARYVVFYCADPMDSDGTHYYESIALDEARHPQTILAYDLNDKALPIPNGAPIRVRIERQLGYKMAKYIMRVELVDQLGHIAGGNGGYWEDQGYEWYAGI